MTAHVLHSVRGWDEFHRFGEAYLKAAQGGQKRPLIFTPEILYNLCGMAIENYFMAYLAWKGHLPENHTLRDLARAAEKLEPLDKEMRQRLHKMDMFQEICSLIQYTRKTPSPQDVLEFLDLTGAVKTYVWERIGDALNLQITAETASGGTPGSQS